VAGFVAAVAASSGLDLELQEVSAQRTNVLARLTPAGSIHQRVVLAPHLDTVGGDDPALLPTARAQRTRPWPRACDTKGSVACMLGALGTLARSATRPRHTEILLAALVDEENAQLGSRFFALRNQGGPRHRGRAHPNCGW
jgi:acetylornithine deacetylase/succinyl-diaminopimelate desuccinylase-like protein